MSVVCSLNDQHNSNDLWSVDLSPIPQDTPNSMTHTHGYGFCCAPSYGSYQNWPFHVRDPVLCRKVTGSCPTTTLWELNMLKTRFAVLTGMTPRPGSSAHVCCWLRRRATQQQQQGWLHPPHLPKSRVQCKQSMDLDRLLPNIYLFRASQLPPIRKQKWAPDLPGSKGDTEGRALVNTARY